MCVCVCMFYFVCSRALVGVTGGLHVLIKQLHKVVSFWAQWDQCQSGGGASSFDASLYCMNADKKYLAEPSCCCLWSGPKNTCSSDAPLQWHEVIFLYCMRSFLTMTLLLSHVVPELNEVILRNRGKLFKVRGWWWEPWPVLVLVLLYFIYTIL